MESNINYDLFNEDYSTSANPYLLNSDYGENSKPDSSKLSMITEDQSTGNFLKEFDCFYTEMMSKVKGIRDTPVLKNQIFPDDVDVDEEQLFTNVKHTPEVIEQLEYIKKLDNEINSVVSQYKMEKEERLQTQYEMYNEITKNAVVEKDTDLFLNLCHFEFSETNKDKVEKVTDNNEKKKVNNVVEDKRSSFIIRNIYLAKGNSSLTDEEKYKLEQLIHLDDECVTSNNPFNRDEDIEKLEDIDNELEKIQLDEEKTEKNRKNDQCKSVMEELERLNDFMLQQRLKRLEAKLKTLREIEEKEVERIKLQQVDDSEDNEKVDCTDCDEAKYIKLAASECDLDADVENFTFGEDEIASTSGSSIADDNTDVTD